MLFQHIPFVIYNFEFYIKGVLDKGTKEKFDQPRCGMKDKLSNGIGTRGKRYVHQGSVWHKKVSVVSFCIWKFIIPKISSL